jgi:hypothetical protein
MDELLVYTTKSSRHKSIYSTPSSSLSMVIIADNRIVANTHDHRQH